MNLKQILMGQIIKTINVQIQLTEVGRTQAILGGSTLQIAKFAEMYIKEKEQYISMGYRIISEDPTKFSFVAEKQSNEEE